MHLRLEAAEVKVLEGRIQRVKAGPRVFVIERTLVRFEHGGRWWRGELPRSYFILQSNQGVRLEVYVVAMLEWTLSAVED